MSRQAHLPPRCPFQRKGSSRPIQEPVSQFTDAGFSNAIRRHQKSCSQSNILEEQPEWLDELLNDPESSSNASMHRRSASDSITLLDGLADSLPGLISQTSKQTLDTEPGGKLELDCIYGPNSPRQRSNSSFADNGIVSALSEYISRSSLEVLDGTLCMSGTIKAEMEGDSKPEVEVNSDTKTGKRHHGQRSRVRKLQYIAELEKTVEVFQAFGSELAVKVASLLQQRVALTMENTELKQKMSLLRKEKLIMEGQYKSLKKELERLKVSLANCPNNKVRTYFETRPSSGSTLSDTTLHLLGMDYLNIN